jgi:hypothetical protein
VFGLCHLFGFRFAPRIRDLKDRRLYLFPGQKPQPILDPLFEGFADVHHITAHWNDVLRLATSIRSGTVTASAILQKRQGLNVSPTIVAHVAPLGWEDVGLTGGYVWSDGQQPSDGSLRPLRRRESMLAA